MFDFKLANYGESSLDFSLLFTGTVDDLAKRILSVSETKLHVGKKSSICFLAKRSNRIDICKGPTPPGTGVSSKGICSADLLTSPENFLKVLSKGENPTSITM